MNYFKQKRLAWYIAGEAMDEKSGDIDYGKALNKIEKGFLAEAKKIGRKYSCFYEAMRDDNGLYINLQPAMDFSKSYAYQPTNQEMVEEFKKFRKEIDVLAERLGCVKTQYLWDPNVTSISEKDKDGRDYMNSLVTSVKESVWKRAGREAAVQDEATQAPPPEAKSQPSTYEEHKNENNYLNVKEGDRVQIKKGIRCLESGKTRKVITFKWPLAVFQNEDNGKTWQGYVNSYVDKVLPAEGEKDPEIYIREFKDKMGYKDGYDPTCTYEEICDRLAHEYTLEAPTDTEATEVEGDAVMMLLRGAKTDKDRKTAYDLGDILMGEKKGGPRNKELLKKIREAFLAMLGKKGPAEEYLEMVQEEAMAQDGFGNFDRSAAMKKAWQTRKEGGPTGTIKPITDNMPKMPSLGK